MTIKEAVEGTARCLKAGAHVNLIKMILSGAGFNQQRIETIILWAEQSNKKQRTRCTYTGRYSMKDLNSFSDEELKLELVKREEAKKKARVPRPLKEMDWSKLVEYVDKSIQEIDEEDEPKDFHYWIFESVMETIYGKDIWKWWNNR